ncbi:MAG: MFS transporter [Epsilonproteobacteria bacterium]|nr:MFS transporter [Campylobacterota bacterium]
MSIMYATQPIQPLLAVQFNIDIIKASSFTAIILLCLAIAPIIYGYILEGFPAKKMLLVATSILLVTNILLGFSNSYEMFFSIRIVEGLLIPAILTSVMSILANLDKHNIKFNMAIYVASTVLGGLIGRIIAGAIATYIGWRYVFFSLSFGLLIALYLINKINYKGDTKLIKAKLNDVVQILKDKRFITIYLTMFTTFFVFAGVLNILPFRIKEISPHSSEFRIGLMYLGYSMGIVVSLLSHKIVKLFKTEINTIIVSTIFYALITLFFASNDIAFIFILLFIFCIGMFTTHTISSGLANSMKVDKKSLTSGMYLTFYYIGGASGSIIPAIIYKYFGWNTVIIFFAFMLLLLAVFLFLNKKYFTSNS